MIFKFGVNQQSHVVSDQGVLTFTDSSITLNTPKTITIQGGWNLAFTSQAPNTTLIKEPKVNQGSLTLQMVTIKP